MFFGGYQLTSLMIAIVKSRHVFGVKSPRIGHFCGGKFSERYFSISDDDPFLIYILKVAVPSETDFSFLHLKIRFNKVAIGQTLLMQVSCKPSHHI